MIAFIINYCKADKFKNKFMCPNQNNYNKQFPNYCDLMDIKSSHSDKKLFKIFTNLK